MPIRLIKRDEPPALTNGSGMPLVGMRLEHDTHVHERLDRHHRGQPEREKRAEAVGRAKRDAEPAPGDHAEAHDHERGADETELFGDDRENEIAVRFRQVEQLLDAFHQTASGDSAGADGNERLDDLKAVAERILPRVEEGEEPAAPIVGAHRDDGDGGQAEQNRAEDVLVVETRGEHHDRGNQRKRHGRAEVGLNQDEADQRADHDGNRQQAVADFIDPVHPPFEQIGNKEDRRELGELRRLDAQSADAEPAPRVVDRRAEHDRNEAQGDDPEAGPDEDRLPVNAVVDAHHHPEQGQSEDRPHQLLGQEEVRAGGTSPWPAQPRRCRPSRC